MYLYTRALIHCRARNEGTMDPNNRDNYPSQILCAPDLTTYSQHEICKWVDYEKVSIVIRDESSLGKSEIWKAFRAFHSVQLIVTIGTLLWSYREGLSQLFATENKQGLCRSCTSKNNIGLFSHDIKWIF